MPNEHDAKKRSRKLLLRAVGLGAGAALLGTLGCSSSVSGGGSTTGGGISIEDAGKDGTEPCGNGACGVIAEQGGDSGEQGDDGGDCGAEGCGTVAEDAGPCANGGCGVIAEDAGVSGTTIEDAGVGDAVTVTTGTTVEDAGQ